VSYISEAADIYKHNYSTEQVTPIIERDHTFYAMTTKKKGGSGADYSYYIPIANPQAVGNVFATVQTAAQNSGTLTGEQATTQPVLKYAIADLDGPSMLRAGDRKGAFFDLLTGHTDAQLEEFGNRKAFDFYRSGTGMRGRRASASTNVITLTVADDVRNFAPKQTIIADDTITGASPRSGSTTVVAVDEDSGTITLASAAAISLFADNDYLFQAGEGGVGSCVDGLALFVPTTAPVYGSDLFRGHDRGQDVRRLAGCRTVDTGSYWEEVIGLTAVKCQNNHFRPNVAFANPLKVFEMAKRENAKIMYKPGKTAEVYFQYIVLNTPAGALEVMADPDCPTTHAYIGNMEYWEELYLGDSYIHPINDAGYQYGIQAAADGIEARFRCLAQTIMRRPGHFGVAQGS